MYSLLADTGVDWTAITCKQGGIYLSASHNLKSLKQVI